jgi:serine/threonine protein kinase
MVQKATFNKGLFFYKLYFDAMQFYNELGSGSYGQEFLCSFKHQIFAVTKILLDASVLDVLVRELIVLKFLQNRSEHVPKLFYVGILSEKKPYLLLVMERCKKMKKKEPKDAGNVLATLAQALETLHKYDIMHRDISPGNIMLRPNGNVAFLDFGLACFAPSSNCRTTFTSRVTTIFARAPELIGAAKKKEYGKEIDLFSLAVTAMHFSGLPVYKNDPKTENYFKNVYAEIQRSLKCIENERYRFSRLLDLTSRPSLASIMSGIPMCTFEEIEGPEDAIDAQKPTIVPDLLLNLNKPEDLYRCTDHIDFTHSLEQSFQDVISGHSKCIQNRASKLCDVLCDGNCLMSSCICFAMSWAFQEHVHTEYVKNIVQFCKCSVSEFVYKFGIFLCYSILVDDVFIPCSRKVVQNTAHLQ